MPPATLVFLGVALLAVGLGRAAHAQPLAQPTAPPAPLAAPAAPPPAAPAAPPAAPTEPAAPPAPLAAPLDPPAPAAAAASASAAAPLRVAIECERVGRTKACPAFLLGFIDANKALLASPRSAAEIVIYVSATEVAQRDHLHLRIVSTIPDTPPVIELTAELDTRADDDRQRAALLPVFLRGLVLHVASRFPASVQIDVRDPTAVSRAVGASPWDVSLEVTGDADYTEQFQSYAGSLTLTVARIERKRRLGLELYGNGALEREPPLVRDDGTEISLDTEEWTLGGGLEGAWLRNDSWSLGGTTRFRRGDAKGQYRYAADVRLGVEWDAFPADDPRGNRLAVFYVAGHQIERYNLRNEIGQRFAQYPVHQLGAAGALRRDKTLIGLTLSVSSEMFRPQRRHRLSISPYIEWKLGSHVDLALSFSITRREIPGPDPSEIDPRDYAQQSRLAYAQPLAMTGSFSLLIHFDRTNGQRNDRFTDL